jgi:hypothetical protein
MRIPDLFFPLLPRHRGQIKPVLGLDLLLRYSS